MVRTNLNTRTYQPINSYGVIGDCHSVVLVAPDGSVDWGCLPDFDSPAIFCRLLDAERGGYFQIAPKDSTIPGAQRYLRGSNVLQTKFASITGEVVLTDFMPVETLRAWPYQGMNNNTWTREDGSCHCLVRAVECTHGELPITMVLKMMTYAPTGSIVAAPTTSLPENLSGERNWDYRFTWLRDATFTLYAFNMLGFTEEARAFTHWLQRLSYTNGEGLQIMYGIRGERGLTECDLSHLSGYWDSRPVRIGNVAAKQKQLDIFGEILDCIHLYRREGCFERYGEKLEGPLWAMMRTLVEHVCAHWQECDEGIWEVRGGSRHFVYSKVMCWVALDRAIKAALELHLEVDLQRWCLVRDQIRADILSRGYNTGLGAFSQAYDDTALDASNLLLPLVGFIPPDDPRMRSTVDRIIEHLTDEQGFVYRYLSDDGLPGSEGTFAICTFWLVDNLAMQGRVDEARSLFERLLSYAGRLGLFSEEIDSQNQIALGNYPQAFTHIALINSAINLQKAERRMSEHHTDPVIAAIKLHAGAPGNG